MRISLRMYWNLYSKKDYGTTNPWDGGTFNYKWEYLQEVNFKLTGNVDEGHVQEFYLQLDEGDPVFVSYELVVATGGVIHSHCRLSNGRENDKPETFDYYLNCDLDLLEKYLKKNKKTYGTQFKNGLDWEYLNWLLDCESSDSEETMNYYITGDKRTVRGLYDAENKTKPNLFTDHIFLDTEK